MPTVSTAPKHYAGPDPNAKMSKNKKKKLKKKAKAKQLLLENQMKELEEMEEREARQALEACDITTPNATGTGTVLGLLFNALLLRKYEDIFIVCSIMSKVITFYHNGVALLDQC